MSMRCIESGWARVTPLDDAERRALWIRILPDKIEFCAGRDGDDAYAVIHLDGRTTEQDVYNLEDVASTAIYAFQLTADAEEARRNIR